MAKEVTFDASSGEGDAATGEKTAKKSKSKKLKRYWRNVEDFWFQIDVDDALYFFVCFISIAVVPLAAIGSASWYYELKVNIQPVSEALIQGLNCSELNAQTANLTVNLVEANTRLCSTETFETRYTLFHRQADYFHFTPTFGVSFCEDEDSFYYKFLGNVVSGQTTASYFGAEDISDEIEELLGGGNIGNCGSDTMAVAAAFAALTMTFALMGLLWLTVLSDHVCASSKRKEAGAIILSSLTMICSLVTIAVYWTSIHPLRPGIDPKFCETQSTFEDCTEAVGEGFYCQVATAVFSFLQILAYSLKWTVGAPDGTMLSCCRKHGEQVPKPLEGDKNSSHHHTHFYKDPHMWIKLGRFLEFFLATVAGMISWTTLELVLPDVDETPVSMSSYLWGKQFCTDGKFSTDIFFLTDTSPKDLGMKPFGACKPFYIYKILFTVLKIIISGGSALFLKRDAAKNPLFYLGGLCADVATIVMVCMAITIFMLQIYPGRSEIDPSFCYQYNTLRNAYLGNDDSETCSIRLGAGFAVLCVVLVLTVVNLVAEFIVGETAEYGAMNAINTVVKRVRRREFQDALYGASSYYISKELRKSQGDTVGDQEDKFPDSVGSKEEDNSDTIPP